MSAVTTATPSRPAQRSPSHKGRSPSQALVYQRSPARGTENGSVRTQPRSAMMASMPRRCQPSPGSETRRPSAAVRRISRASNTNRASAGPGRYQARAGRGVAGVMLSLVVPIYNEEALIDRLHAEVVPALDATELPWEVVYVNDGSRDRSLEMLLAKQLADPRVV